MPRDGRLPTFTGGPASLSEGIDPRWRLLKSWGLGLLRDDA
jgi:hypothetical protein